MSKPAAPRLALQDVGKATAALNVELIRELLRLQSQPRTGDEAATPRQLYFDLGGRAGRDSQALAEQLARLIERLRGAGPEALYRSYRKTGGLLAGSSFHALPEAEIESLLAGDRGVASIAKELAPALERSQLALLAVETDMEVLAAQPLGELLAVVEKEAAGGAFARLLLPGELRPQGAVETGRKRPERGRRDEEGGGRRGPGGRRRRSDGRLAELAAGGSGAGVVLGVVDFGCDFACPNFRHADGRTRLLSLWDQNAPAAANGSGGGVPYGRAYDARAIDAALAGGRPYETLGYHPHDNYYLDSVGRGAHGTAMLDLAAGNGRAYAGGAPGSLAPEAEVVFVQVGIERAPGNRRLLPLGRVLDGIRYVFEQAGSRPAVVNVSLNANGGPHDGATEFDEAVRALVEAGGKAPRAVVVAAGNFGGQGLHARLLVGGQAAGGAARGTAPGMAGGAAGNAPEAVTRWRIDPRDPSQNDLELWYDSEDGELALDLRVGDAGPWLAVEPGEVKQLLREPEAPEEGAAAVVGLAVGSHEVPRLLGPGRGSRPGRRFQAAVSLTPAAWSGLSSAGFELQLRLRPAGGAAGSGPLVADLYLQRDDYLQHGQSRLSGPAACSDGTLGSLSCGGGLFVVGALDELGATAQPFLPSSEGPTRDGRGRPEAYVGGVGVPVLRSLALDWRADSCRPAHLVTACASGTSAAAARLSGALAARLSRTPKADAAKIAEWIAEAGLAERGDRRATA